MYLPDYLIAEACRNEAAPLVTPFDPDCINPASIDLKLGDEFVNLKTKERFQANEIMIYPGDAFLATTIEYVRLPANLAGQIALKSSLAREGLNHLLAGFCDPGFSGKITLEIYSVIPITLNAGDRVVQLLLARMAATPIKPYQGRYQGQEGPTESRRRR